MTEIVIDTGDEVVTIGEITDITITIDGGSDEQPERRTNARVIGSSGPGRYLFGYRTDDLISICGTVYRVTKLQAGSTMEESRIRVESDDGVVIEGPPDKISDMENSGETSGVNRNQ